MILNSLTSSIKRCHIRYGGAIWMALLWLTLWNTSLAAPVTDKSKKIRYTADVLEGGEQQDTQEPYRQLNGNVVFTQENFTIYADTAQYYDKQGICYATGNLRMEDRDGGIMVADEVIYHTNDQMAELQGNVIYTKEEEEHSFYTHNLEYFVKDKKCVFHNGGTLIQKDNQIESQEGYYSDKNKLAVFTDQVRFTNPEYTVDCDKLSYHTQTKVTEFTGNTQIVTKENQTLVTPIGGTYNTETKNACFHEATLFTEDCSIYGHLIKGDQEKKYYTIDGNIKFTSQKHNTSILGNHSYYDQAEGIAEIYGNPILEKTTEDDTLYMVADKFKFIEDVKAKEKDQKDHIIQAYKNVRIYKSNLQGKAKSLEYHSIDAKIQFYDKPVFWSNSSQITAENISLVLSDDQVEKMYMDTNALLVSELVSKNSAAEDPIANYNQMRGKEMTAYFNANAMQYIDVEGNGESIFFIQNEAKELVGMNYLRSSHIRIDMKGDTLSKISFFLQPQGNFYPTHKIEEERKLFDNFVWRIQEKPELNEFLAIKSLHDHAYIPATTETENVYV